MHAGEVMAKTLLDFEVQWRSFNPATGHATPLDSDRALCGVETLENAGQNLSDTQGRIGCQRCAKALSKLGIRPTT